MASDPKVASASTHGFTRPLPERSLLYDKEELSECLAKLAGGVVVIRVGVPTALTLLDFIRRKGSEVIM